MVGAVHLLHMQWQQTQHFSSPKKKKKRGLFQAQISQIFIFVPKGHFLHLNSH
jgi:hypothetical protein